MNLEEIGSFKNKVVSKLINDENILDVLLGDVDNIEDPETALLGKDGSGKGGCVFKYEFVPDTQENSKTFLCVEVVGVESVGEFCVFLVCVKFTAISGVDFYCRIYEIKLPIFNGDEVSGFPTIVCYDLSPTQINIWYVRFHIV